MAASQPPRFATTQEVAEYLRVPVETLYNWRHRGKGPPAIRYGRGLRYQWKDVQDFVDTVIRNEKIDKSA